jgi:hypothetical protein
MYVMLEDVMRLIKPAVRIDVRGKVIIKCNCVMTNVMERFLIYLLIYLRLTCFGLSFSPSSEAGVQLRQWFKSTGYGVSARET